MSINVWVMIWVMNTIRCGLFADIKGWILCGIKGFYFVAIIFMLFLVVKEHCRIVFLIRTDTPRKNVSVNETYAMIGHLHQTNILQEQSVVKILLKVYLHLPDEVAGIIASFVNDVEHVCNQTAQINIQ